MPNRLDLAPIEHATRAAVRREPVGFDGRRPADTFRIVGRRDLELATEFSIGHSTKVDTVDIAVLTERDGELRVNLVSDDNFDTGLQRTLLLQFSYKP